MMRFILLAVSLLYLTSIVTCDDGLNAWIQKQSVISLKNMLDNIGDQGSQVKGAPAGVVVASPSKASPNYYYQVRCDSLNYLMNCVQTKIFYHSSVIYAMKAQVSNKNAKSIFDSTLFWLQISKSNFVFYRSFMRNMTSLFVMTPHTIHDILMS